MKLTINGSVPSLRVIVALVGVLAFIACSSGSIEEAAPQRPPLSEGVMLELKVDLSQSGRPVLNGETNLPDDTIIMTSVYGKTSDFRGQDRVTVNNGSFRAGPFGSVTGLSDGKYIASATMPIPRVQGASVQSVEFIHN